MQEIETLQEAKEYVYNQEDSIKKIISPSDLIHQDITEWDNADKELLRDELVGSMGDSWTYGINHPYGDIIEQLAVKQFVDDMQRIPMNDLNPEIYKGIEDMAVNGYWPNQTNRQEIEEIVYEWKDDIEFFHEYESHVMQEIEASIIDARLKDF